MYEKRSFIRYRSCKFFFNPSLVLTKEMPIDAVNNCVFSSPSNESNTPGTAYGPTHLACSISWARRHSSKTLFSLLKNVCSRHLWREPFFLMEHYRSDPSQNKRPARFFSRTTFLNSWGQASSCCKAARRYLSLERRQLLRVFSIARWYHNLNRRFHIRPMYFR